jgi:hypothetical protein
MLDREPGLFDLSLDHVDTHSMGYSEDNGSNDHIEHNHRVIACLEKIVLEDPTLSCYVLWVFSDLPYFILSRHYRVG